VSGKVSLAGNALAVFRRLVFKTVLLELSSEIAGSLARLVSLFECRTNLFGFFVFSD
jgi:hypothetical protein